MNNHVILPDMPTIVKYDVVLAAFSEALCQATLDQRYALSQAMFSNGTPEAQLAAIKAVMETEANDAN